MEFHSWLGYKKIEGKMSSHDNLDLHHNRGREYLELFLHSLYTFFELMHRFTGKYS